MIDYDSVVPGLSKPVRIWVLIDNLVFVFSFTWHCLKSSEETAWLQNSLSLRVRYMHQHLAKAPSLPKISLLMYYVKLNFIIVDLSKISHHGLVLMFKGLWHIFHASEATSRYFLNFLRLSCAKTPHRNTLNTSHYRQ
jgi:hypothetical protein